MVEFEGEFDEVRVDGVVAAGDDRDFVEPVGAPHLLELGLGHRGTSYYAAGPARLRLRVWSPSCHRPMADSTIEAGGGFLPDV